MGTIQSDLKEINTKILLCLLLLMIAFIYSMIGGGF